MDTTIKEELSIGPHTGAHLSQVTFRVRQRDVVGPLIPVFGHKNPKNTVFGHVIGGFTERTDPKPIEINELWKCVVGSTIPDPLDGAQTKLRDRVRHRGWVMPESFPR